mgnify:CR=1 FL=1
MAIDPKLIDDLNSRRKKVILSGGQEKIDKRHEKGEMTARDRMGYLFEEGTFSEIGKRGESAVDGAWGKIEAAAQEIMKGKPDMRYADAIDAACIAHPELVQEYEKSRR